MKPTDSAARHEELFYDNGLGTAVHCLTLHVKGSPGRPSTPPHYHEYIEILYGLTGEVNAHIGERSFTFGEGDLMLINAGEVHTFSAPRDASYHVIKFLPSLLQSGSELSGGMRYLFTFSHVTGVPRILRAAELSATPIPEQVDAVMREWETRAPGFELGLHAEILMLVRAILRLEKADFQTVSDAPPALDLVTALRRAITLAEEQFPTLNGESAARAVGLSYCYFSRSFARYVGMGFSAYLEALRIRESERLLGTTDRSVTNIAAAVGFSSTSYFITRFRRHNRMTPREFRAFYQK